MSISTIGSFSKLVFTSIALVAVLGMQTHRAEAVPILVPNGGFETSVLGDGSFDAAPISDWVVTGTFVNAGAYNSTDAEFVGTTGGSIPSPGEGLNVHLSNITRSATAGTGFSTFTSAASLATVEAGATYMLTVAAGHRATGGGTPDSYQIEMLLDDVVFAPSTVILDGNTITASTFANMLSTFTATSAQAGATLKVQLTHSTFVGTGIATGHFDNVRLDFTAPPVPEPSSFLLLGLGSLGLLRHTRRHTQRRRRRA